MCCLRQYLSIAPILLLVLSTETTAAEQTISDDAGNILTATPATTRIVSTAPSVTELLFDIGAGKTIVGTVEFSDYPDAAKIIPRVGSYHRLDLERIIALKPDLIVSWKTGNSALDIARLRDMGYRIYVAEPRKLGDIMSTMKRLGVLTANIKTSEKQAARFSRRIAKLGKRYSRLSTVSMMYQIWDKPLMTVNDSHLIADVIRLCGGSNVYGDINSLTPVISIESVLRLDPQVIVAGGMSESQSGWLKPWQKWPQLSAVKNNHLVFIPPSLLQRHSPRILDGAERLCVALESARNGG